MVNPENDDSVCLFVEDTGEGIPQECQKEIFDRFYKVIGSRKRQPFYRYITTRKTAGGSLMSSVFLWGNTRMLLKKLIEERDIIKSQR